LFVLFIFLLSVFIVQYFAKLYLFTFHGDGHFLGFQLLPIIKTLIAGCWWLILVILATQEAEIRRIAVQNQPRQIVLETLSQKSPS
jgi:hypothetical protein